MFHSVSLVDCRGAFHMWLAVSASALLVLLVEMAVHKHASLTKRWTRMPLGRPLGLPIRVGSPNWLPAKKNKF